MVTGSRSQSLLGWVVSFLIICSVTIVLRFWSARLQKRRLYLDDILVFIGYISAMVMSGISIWGIANGLGKSTLELSPNELIVQAQVLLAASVTWLVSTMIIKLAMLWLYARIFETPRFRLVSRILMVVCVCYGIAFAIVFITQCDPVSQQWNPVPWGSCKDLSHSELTSNAINALLDTSIVVLPMPWLWNLRMPLRNKIWVTIMFSLGFMTIAIMLYRIYTTVHEDPDAMIALAQVGLLSGLELWIGIIVTCMPTMTPLFKTYVKPAFTKISAKMFGGFSKSTDGQAPIQLNTIGGSDPEGPRRKFRSNYTEISDSFNGESHQSGDIPLVTAGVADAQDMVRMGRQAHIEDV